MITYSGELHPEGISNICYASRLSDLSSVRLNGASTRFPMEKDAKSCKRSNHVRPMCCAG